MDQSVQQCGPPMPPPPPPPPPQQQRHVPVFVPQQMRSVDMEALEKMINEELRAAETQLLSEPVIMMRLRNQLKDALEKAKCEKILIAQAYRFKRMCIIHGMTNGPGGSPLIQPPVISIADLLNRFKICLIDIKTFEIKLNLIDDIIQRLTPSQSMDIDQKAATVFSFEEMVKLANGKRPAETEPVLASIVKKPRGEMMPNTRALESTLEMMSKIISDVNVFSTLGEIKDILEKTKRRLLPNETSMLKILDDVKKGNFIQYNTRYANGLAQLVRSVIEVLRSKITDQGLLHLINTMDVDLFTD